MHAKHFNKFHTKTRGCASCSWTDVHKTFNFSRQGLITNLDQHLLLQIPKLPSHGTGKWCQFVTAIFLITFLARCQETIFLNSNWDGSDAQYSLRYWLREMPKYPKTRLVISSPTLETSFRLHVNYYVHHYKCNRSSNGYTGNISNLLVCEISLYI